MWSWGPITTLHYKAGDIHRNDDTKLWFGQVVDAGVRKKEEMKKRMKRKENKD